MNNEKDEKTATGGVPVDAVVIPSLPFCKCPDCKGTKNDPCPVADEVRQNGKLDPVVAVQMAALLICSDLESGKVHDATLLAKALCDTLDGDWSLMHKLNRRLDFNKELIAFALEVEKEGNSRLSITASEILSRYSV